MRENLLFYDATEEGGDENYITVVKDIMKTHLKWNKRKWIPCLLLIGMARKTNRFHYPMEKKNVRYNVFDNADSLKRVKIGIGAQLPRNARDAVLSGNEKGKIYGYWYRTQGLTAQHASFALHIYYL